MRGIAGIPVYIARMDHISALTLDSAVHLIQVALTPVFLLSGIAALLNVFATRLARVSDRLDSLTEADAGELGWLHARSLVLDTAVVLATAGAAATCVAILTLFLFEISNKTVAAILLAFFGLAIICTLGAVTAYGIEMLLSSRAMRARMPDTGK